jgi:endonuclease/exonuclease/phosphatase family metal-dependent hydrolase
MPAKTAVKTTTNGLSILSYNIHKGFSMNRRFVLDAIKEAIRTTHTDLVFLQEIVGEHSRHSRKTANWPENTQFEFLADSIWTHYAYGKNAVYVDGHHGNAILSKHPIIAWENLDISSNRFERRGLLHATIHPLQKDSEPVHAICVHLDLFERGRKQQLKHIINRIQRHVPSEAPLILAGDFNDWRESASPVLCSELGVTEAYLSLHGKHAVSFPTWFPFLRLDRIYLRGFSVLEARCFTEPPWSSLSDHGALLARVNLK